MKTISLHLPHCFSTHVELLYGTHQEVILMALFVLWHHL